MRIGNLRDPWGRLGPRRRVYVNVPGRVKRLLLFLLGLTVLGGVTSAIVFYRATGSIPIRPRVALTANSFRGGPPSAETEFSWDDAKAPPAHAYIRPAVERYLEDAPATARVLDLGCGNGALLGTFRGRDWELFGLDISVSGIDQGMQRYPDITFLIGDATGDIESVVGDQRFDVVVSTEVIEHVYDPRGLARNAFTVLEPGGVLVLSTPYHGYLKNLAIAATGKTDVHFNPLIDHGHIKFFSVRSLAAILWGAVFRDLEFTGTGRFPYMWKSMVIRAVKPQASAEGTGAGL